MVTVREAWLYEVIYLWAPKSWMLCFMHVADLIYIFVKWLVWFRLINVLYLQKNVKGHENVKI